MFSNKSSVYQKDEWSCLLFISGGAWQEVPAGQGEWGPSAEFGSIVMM